MLILPVKSASSGVFQRESSLFDKDAKTVCSNPKSIDSASHVNKPVDKQHVTPSDFFARRQ